MLKKDKPAIKDYGDEEDVEMNVSAPADNSYNDALANQRVQNQVSLLSHFVAETHLMQNSNLQQLARLQAQES